MLVNDPKAGFGQYRTTVGSDQSRQEHRRTQGPATKVEILAHYLSYLWDETPCELVNASVQCRSVADGVDTAIANLWICLTVSDVGGRSDLRGWCGFR